MDKIEDFGVHADQYYPLKVEIYKTKLDEKLLELLWNKYWVATLSQSLLLSASRFLQQVSLGPCHADQRRTERTPHRKLKTSIPRSTRPAITSSVRTMPSSSSFPRPQRR